MGMVEHIRKRLGMYWLTHDGIPDASVWIFLRTIRFTRQIEPSCLIYITDGYGPAPDNPPPYPVLWILTGDGASPGNGAGKYGFTNHDKFEMKIHLKCK